MEATAPAILEIALLLLAAAAGGWLSRRAGLPGVIGYLAVGAVVSPFTPGFVADRTQLQLLADVGVILLLFEVGIEIDLLRLGREHGALLWAAPAQLLITAGLAAAGAMVAGMAWQGAAVIGLALGLSSSAVIVNITRSSRRTTDRRTEEALLGWSVVQDVAGVVLAALLISLVLPRQATGDAAPSPLAMVGGLVLFIGIAAATAWLLPRVLRVVHGEHDTFLIISVASGLAIAGAGALLFHLPMALAAFIAGLAITESHHADEARRRLRPFRDLFAVFFFVVIGTLIDPGELGPGWPWLVGLLGGLVIGKVLVTYLLARLARLSGRPAQLAVGLGQVGEFSFVLASVGVAAGVIDHTVFSALLAAVAVSIAGSSVLVRYVPRRANAG